MKYIVLRSSSDNLVLDVSSNAWGCKGQGKEVGASIARGTRTQLWSLEPASPGYFMIRSKLNGMVLDMSRDPWGWNKKGKQVGVWAAHVKANQQWSVVAAPYTCLNPEFFKKLLAKFFNLCSRRRSGEDPPGGGARGPPRRRRRAHKIENV